MAAIVWADVTNFDSDLSAVDSTAQTDILNHVNSALAVSEWGGETAYRLRLGRIFLAAHYGSVSLRGGFGPSGPVESEKAGDLARTYASGDSFDTTGLNSTSWGQQFLALVDELPTRAGCVL